MRTRGSTCRIPWFILLSRFCRWAGFAALLLILARVRPLAYRDASSELLRVLQSEAWADQTLKAVFWLFMVGGLILAFGRKETRGITFLTMMLVAMLAGIMGAFLKLETRFRYFWQDLYLICFAAVPGVFAALFERMYGYQAWVEWAHAHGITAPPKPLWMRYPKALPRKRESGDFLPYPYLLLLIVCLTYLGIRTVSDGKTGVWVFVIAGALALLLWLYWWSRLRVSVPFALILSRQTRAVGVLAALLTARHMALYINLDDAARGLNLPALYQSAHWTDQMLFAALVLFALLGMWLALYRKETRKLAGYGLIVWIVAIALGGSLVNNREQRTGLSLMLGSLLVYSWFLWTGALAMLFERLHGEAAVREERGLTVKNRQKEKPQPAVPPAAPKPRPAVPPVAPKPRPTVPPMPVRPLQFFFAGASADADRQPTDAASLLLTRVADRLYPDESILETLEGQRQLLIWLMEGTPDLKPLMLTKAAKALIDKTMPDDPVVFRQHAYELAGKVGMYLNGRLPVLSAKWQALPPESLAEGWYALGMYGRMTQDATPFERAADAIAEVMSGRPDAMRWLRITAR